MISKKKTRIAWTAESEKLLIQLWKKNPKVKYTARISNSDSYRKNQNLLEKMALEFDKRGLNIGPCEISCKIHNLCNKYRQEKAKNCPSDVINSEWNLFNDVQQIIDSSQDTDFGDMSFTPQEKLKKSCSPPPYDQAETQLVADNPIWSEDSESESLKSCSWWPSLEGEIPQIKKIRKRFLWKGFNEKLMLKLWSLNPKVTRSQKDKPILEKISFEFQKRGIQVSPVEIGIKLHNLKVTYRREKAKIRKVKGYRTQWRLYDEVHKIYGPFDLTHTLMNNNDFESSELTYLPGPRSSMPHNSSNLYKPSLFGEEIEIELEKELMPSVPEKTIQKNKKIIWNNQSENVLIKLWSKNPEISHKVKDKSLLEKMSLVLKKKGIYVSPEEISSKIKNLEMKYCWEKHKMSQRNGYHSAWKLFEAVHRIIGDVDERETVTQNLENEGDFENSEFFTLLPEHDSSTHLTGEKSENGPSELVFKSQEKLSSPKKNIPWNEENEGLLIKFWSKNPKMTEYSENMPILRKISREFQKYGIDITPCEIGYKLHELRDKYRKEMEKMCPLEDLHSDWKLFDAVHDILERSQIQSMEYMEVENDFESSEFLELLRENNSPTESIESCSQQVKAEAKMHKESAVESQQLKICRQLGRIHDELREWRKEKKEIEEKKTALFEKQVNTICELKDAFLSYLNRAT